MSSASWIGLAVAIFSAFPITLWVAFSRGRSRKDRNA